MATRIVPTGVAEIRRPRSIDPVHLDYIRLLPCVACGVEKFVEAAHLRAASALYGKKETGGSRRPDDVWALPLCSLHHRDGKSAQHKMNELEFWKRMNIDPFALALALYFHSPDIRTGGLVVLAHRLLIPKAITQLHDKERVAYFND